MRATTRPRSCPRALLKALYFQTRFTILGFALRLPRASLASPPPSASSQLPPPPVAGALLRVLARGRLLTHPVIAARLAARAVPSGSRRLGFTSSSCPQYISPFDTARPLIRLRLKVIAYSSPVPYFVLNCTRRRHILLAIELPFSRLLVSLPRLASPCLARSVLRCSCAYGFGFCFFWTVVLDFRGVGRV
ncbi:uncharacterized protein SCHCODRAFT_02010961 [Schizophyllum commune H4-8]|uniref:Expressed protein n=1 Tax=Schizophyllum commune (strain H4-8 / FGSC 9210) TaxID=578458 RepID=D8PT68_SCHCM|nr:uncharacterized protein SCHCODRAFT_02010961 [Schizophyllum commune H4-8]KAI5899413.1 hypothetical protein SCHCODRAFT_02010961 [Schizophyllum commune H4-8]